MPTWCTSALLIQGAPARRAALCAALPGLLPPVASPHEELIVGEGADGSPEVILITAWEPPLAWVDDLSRSWPDLTLTIGWMGETGSPLGWRRLRQGDVQDAAHLDSLAWHTPHEWATAGREIFARAGIVSLLDDCDDRVMYPDA